MSDVKFNKWSTFITSELITVVTAIVGILGVFQISGAADIGGNVISIIGLVGGGVTAIASIVYNIIADHSLENLKVKVADIVTTASGVLIAVFEVLVLTDAISVTTNVSGAIVMILGFLGTAATTMFEKFKELQAEPAK